jgi:type III secretory pathway lipoprotein EscJ
MVVANGISGLSYDKVFVALFPVKVQKQTPDAEHKMISVMGIWVQADSAGTLITLLLFFGAIVAVMGGSMFMLLRRQRKAVYQLSSPLETKHVSTLADLEQV